MAKTLEQVEGLEDLQFLKRGDRVKIIDLDDRQKEYEAAVYISLKGNARFLIPHPGSPEDTIRKYSPRPGEGNIIFDLNKRAFKLPVWTSISNFPRIKLKHQDYRRAIGEEQEYSLALELAGFPWLEKLESIDDVNALRRGDRLRIQYWPEDPVSNLKFLEVAFHSLKEGIVTFIMPSPFKPTEEIVSYFSLVSSLGYDKGYGVIRLNGARTNESYTHRINKETDRPLNTAENQEKTLTLDLAGF